MYKHHTKTKLISSCAAIRAKSQYGHFVFQNNNINKNIKREKVIDFIEKPLLNLWVNIGYFFFKKEALLYFNKYYKTDLEMGIVKKLANKKS